MNSLVLCQWRTSFADVLFETDQVRFKSRIADASSAIDERLQSAAEVGGIERISIETARRSLAALERQPMFVPKPRVEKTVTVTPGNGPNSEAKQIQHGIGSHVRVALPSGQTVTAEIVVIFTASSGKNILVSFDQRLVRIGPDQILDCMSAKA
jgi:hypothetical protein